MADTIKASTDAGNRTALLWEVIYRFVCYYGIRERDVYFYEEESTGLV